MTGYVIRRLLVLPLTLVIVSFLTFSIARFGPGDPRATEAARPIQQRIAELEAEYKVVADRVTAIRQADIRNTITLADVGGREKELPADAFEVTPPSERFAIKTGVR